jgi:hypothetical protein
MIISIMIVHLHPAGGLGGEVVGDEGPVQRQLVPVDDVDVRAQAGPGARKVLGWLKKMQVGPCIPAGIQLGKAAVGPTAGPTGRLSHLSSPRSSSPKSCAVSRHCRRTWGPAALPLQQ